MMCIAFPRMRREILLHDMHVYPSLKGIAHGITTQLGMGFG